MTVRLLSFIISNCVAMSPFKISRKAKSLFVVLFYSAPVKARFKSVHFLSKSVLMWVEVAAVPSAREIVEKLDSELSRRSTARKESQVLVSANLTPRDHLRHLSTELGGEACAVRWRRSG